MSLRNQPYLPLYIQDYLTDEKLNMCSWKTQGIYIKIMCVLHKQDIYGAILFKQNDKQNDKQNSNICFDFVFEFAQLLVKNIPCQIDDMTEALKELIEHRVLIIKDNKLLQKRMLRDGEISEIRSKAGKKGGGNPILFKQKDKQPIKQKDKQITEYENQSVFSSINTSNIDTELSKSNLYRKPNAPTYEKVEMAFFNSGGTKEMAKAFFDKHESTGWFLNNSPIVNFVSLVGSFIINWHKNTKTNGNNSIQKNGLSSYELELQKKREAAKNIKPNYD